MMQHHVSDFMRLAFSGEAASILAGMTAQPVRLVLLLLAGSREGENDILEFRSVEDAVAYGRKVYGVPEFQLEGIENANGKSLIGYDHLNDLCRSPLAIPRHRLGRML